MLEQREHGRLQLVMWHIFANESHDSQVVVSCQMLHTQFPGLNVTVTTDTDHQHVVRCIVTEVGHVHLGTASISIADADRYVLLWTCMMNTMPDSQYTSLHCS